MKNHLPKVRVWKPQKKSAQPRILIEQYERDSDRLNIIELTIQQADKLIAKLERQLERIGNNDFRDVP